jgi:hypothetical protein
LGPNHRRLKPRRPPADRGKRHDSIRHIATSLHTTVPPCSDSSIGFVSLRITLTEHGNFYDLALVSPSAHNKIATREITPQGEFIIAGGGECDPCRHYYKLAVSILCLWEGVRANQSGCDPTGASVSMAADCAWSAHVHRAADADDLGECVDYHFINERRHSRRGGGVSDGMETEQNIPDNNLCVLTRYD